MFGCPASDGAKVVDPADPAKLIDPSTVDPTIKLNIVALTSGPTGAEFTSGIPSGGCGGGGHVDWPCDIQSSLEASFREASGGDLCVTHHNGSSHCLDIETTAVWTLADIQATQTYQNLSANDPTHACMQLIDGGSDPSLCPGGSVWDPGLSQNICDDHEQPQWLAEVGSACHWEELLPTDPWTVTVFMYKSTVGDDSYGTWRGWQPDRYEVLPELIPPGFEEPSPKMCGAAVFIEEERFQPTRTEYLDMAANHELGHAFGLDHVCYALGGAASGIDPDTRNNVMASSVDTRCCCECGDQVLRDNSLDWDDDDTGLSSADVSADPRMASYLADACVDCSAVVASSGYVDTGAPDCPEDTSEPFASCDATCGGDQLDGGTRLNGFTDLLPGRWYLPSAPSPPGGGMVGQVERIHQFIEARQVCQAVIEAAESRRVRPIDAAACVPGVGTFAFVPETSFDSDDDGSARFQLQPILLSGDHLPPDAWITQASLVEAGTPG